MALTQAEEKRIADLEAKVAALEATITALRDVTPFVGYVTAKYIGDGQSKEWQVRPALPIGDDTLIVLAPDDEGGVYTVRGAKQNNSRHIPGTFHTSEG